MRITLGAATTDIGTPVETFQMGLQQWLTPSVAFNDLKSVITGGGAGQHTAVFLAGLAVPVGVALIVLSSMLRKR